MQQMLLPTLALSNRFKGSKAKCLTLSCAAAPLAIHLSFVLGTADRPTATVTRIQRECKENLKPLPLSCQKGFAVLAFYPPGVYNTKIKSLNFGTDRPAVRSAKEAEGGESR